MYEYEELARRALDIDEEEDIEEAMMERYGIASETFYEIADDLLPFTYPIQSPFGGWKHTFGVFSDDYKAWTALAQIDSGMKTEAPWLKLQVVRLYVASSPSLRLPCQPWELSGPATLCRIIPSLRPWGLSGRATLCRTILSRRLLCARRQLSVGRS